MVLSIVKFFKFLAHVCTDTTVLSSLDSKRCKTY